jgi:peptide chain release factor subunit 1
VTAYLKDEDLKADLIKDKGTRTNVKNAISSIHTQLKNYQSLPPHGLAIFCGKSGTREGAAHPCMIIEPVEPLHIYLYRCASTYDLEPLKEMLGVMNVYGLIAIDVREAYWGFLRGNQIEFVGSATANVPSKQKKGGQAAPRFQRSRQTEINDFFARVGEHAGTAFLSERDYFKRFRGVLIGGQTPTRENFLAGNYLNHEVQQRVIGTFEVARTDKAGLWELVDNAQDVIKGMDAENMKVLVDRFNDDLKNKTGFAVHGEEDVRKQLAAGAVGTLLLSASLRKKRYQITCQQCGHVDDRTFTLEPGTGVKDILTHTCRSCSLPIIEDPAIDITEELTRMADQIHAKTVIIPENYEAGSQLVSEYGGIGALLRYKTGQ